MGRGVLCEAHFPVPMSTHHTATIRYSPLRIGFLVRFGHLDDLLRAVELNTILWGGIVNPVIPVSKDCPQTVDELLRTFRVQALCAAAPEPELKDFVSASSLVDVSIGAPESILSVDLATEKNKATVLDLMSLVDLHWQRDFKHMPSDTKSRFAVLEWPEQDPLKHLLSVAFGRFPTDLNLRDDYSSDFIRRLRASKTSIDSTKDVSSDLGDQITPLMSTAAELKMLGGRFRDIGGVFVGDASCFSDLVAFWNVRASGSTIRFLPHEGEIFRPLVQAHIRQLHDVATPKQLLPDRIIFYYGSLKSETVRSIAASFEMDKQMGFGHIHAESLSGLPEFPDVEFSHDFVPSTISTSSDGYALHVNFPEKRFLADQDRSRFQRFSTSIEPISEIEYDGHTLRPPHVPALQSFFRRRMLPYHSGSQIVGREFRRLVRGIDRSETVYAVSHWDIIEAVFGEIGYRATASSAGLLAQRITETIGGLGHTRVFKIRGVRDLIRSMKSTDDITKGGATNLIRNDGQFQNHETLYIENRRKSPLDSSQVFTFLIRKGFFRCGLSLRCKRCYLDNWKALKELDDVWPCTYCGARNAASPELISDSAWRFRKSGLLAKDNNQEGAIPVILTLLMMHELFDRESFIWSFSLNLEKGGKTCEADFCAIVDSPGGRWNRPEIVVGECKSDGGRIEQEDVDNLVSVCKDLRALGLDSFVAFAKTSGAFCSGETTMLKKLEKEGVGPVLLTNRELEPLFPYDQEDKEQGWRSFPRSIRDLAENSVLRYLG